MKICTITSRYGKLQYRLFSHTSSLRRIVIYLFLSTLSLTLTYTSVNFCSLCLLNLQEKQCHVVENQKNIYFYAKFQ